MNPGKARLDKLLFCLRFAKSRALAQRWIDQDHMRLNGVRVTKHDQGVSVGDVLTLPLARQVLVIELLALPQRRGAGGEARACYRPLDAGPAKAIAGRQPPQAERTVPQ
ncbi:MAG: S4 domain-containing protein [Croceibacterium sp.]